MAKRYQPSELIGEHGGVQTFAGRDVVNGLPVRVYSFVGEPTLKEGELRSDFIPPVLSSSFTGLAGEVVSAFSDEFKHSKGAVAPGQVEALLRETAAALDDAAKTGVVHGDLSPERVFFDREGGASGRFVLEGYGVPWPVRPSEFSAPERISGPSFAADIFSWARTIKHLSGPLSGDLRDLLDRCLNADPGARPHAREVRASLERYPFGGQAPKPNPQVHRDTSAFERYAEDDLETEDGSGDDLGNLTLPPKTFKLKEYQRQHGAAQPPPPQQETPSTPAPGAAQPTPDVLGATPSSGPSSNAPLGQVRLVPNTPETRRTTDSLRQLDATEAYKERLAVYNAKHSPQSSASSDSDMSDSAPSATPIPTPPPKVLQTLAPETTQTAEPAEPAPPPRIRVQPVADVADSKGDVRAEPPRTKWDEPDDFEVIDDIDDRAPDPTLYRGGRRVLLLTLLGIALLVLLALQFINA